MGDSSSVIKSSVIIVWVRVRMDQLEYIIKDLIEVKLKSEDAFLVVKETLTRMGVASRKNMVLYQSCHILHKRSRYYIVHFKELYMLDGCPANFDELDRGRRNTIANILSEWGLVELVDPTKSASPTVPPGHIKILPHAEKKLWTLEAKYEIGNNNNR